MSVRSKTYAVFDGSGDSKTLPGLCDRLLSEQKETWPELGSAYERFKDTRSKDFQCRSFSVRLLLNPGRAVNTLAELNPEAVKIRPCFLCPANLPAEQAAILYRNEYLILCNPRPAVPRHFTIAHMDHRPQTIGGAIRSFLGLIDDFGPGWLMLYNGPRCGASAPDHLHFQAIPAGSTPVEGKIAEGDCFTEIAHNNGAVMKRAKGLGREMLVLTGSSLDAIKSMFDVIMEAFWRHLAHVDEPMMNVAGFMGENTWNIVIFPRAKHRPDAFFREGEERLAVSPAVMEMAGIFIVPLERDYERLTPSLIKDIYREVSLNNELTGRVLSHLTVVRR